MQSPIARIARVLAALAEKRGGGADAAEARRRSRRRRLNDAAIATHLLNLGNPNGIR